MTDTVKSTFDVYSTQVACFIAQQTRLNAPLIKKVSICPYTNEKELKFHKELPFKLTMEGALLNKKGKLNGNIISAIRPYSTTDFDITYISNSLITVSVDITLYDVIRDMFRETYPEYLTYTTNVISVAARKVDEGDDILFSAEIENIKTEDEKGVDEIMDTDESVETGESVQTHFVDEENDEDIVPDSPDDFDIESSDEWDGEWDDLVEDECIQTYTDDFDREAETADLDKEIDEFLADSEEPVEIDEDNDPFTQKIPKYGFYLCMNDPHSYKVLYSGIHVDKKYAILVLISKTTGYLGGLILAEKDNPDVSLEYSLYKDPGNHKFLWGETADYQYLLCKFVKGYKPSMQQAVLEFGRHIDALEFDDLVKLYNNHINERKASVDEVKNTMEGLANFLFEKEE